MNQLNFSLIPFDSTTSPNITITGRLSRQHNQLKIEYILTGDLAAIIIPAPTTDIERQYDLWEHTCLELFLGIKNKHEYWEFNLSPSRNWNVFHFLRYRHNIAEEMNFAALPFTVWHQQNCFELNLKLDLTKILIAEQDLEVGITAVVENKDRQLSYWALKHPGIAADFHHRDSFVINP